MRRFQTEAEQVSVYHYSLYPSTCTNLALWLQKHIKSLYDILMWI